MSCAWVQLQPASLLTAGTEVIWHVNAPNPRRRHGLHRDALALARCRLDPAADPVFGRLLQQLLQLRVQPDSVLRQHEQQGGRQEVATQPPGQPAPQDDEAKHSDLATQLAEGSGVNGQGAPGAFVPDDSQVAKAADVGSAQPPAHLAAPTESSSAVAAAARDGACPPAKRPVAGGGTAGGQQQQQPPQARPVPAEALAMQLLLVGRPLQAAQALQSAGGASALATASLLCARAAAAAGAAASVGSGVAPDAAEAEPMNDEVTRLNYKVRHDYRNVKRA